MRTVAVLSCSARHCATTARFSSGAVADHGPRVASAVAWDWRLLRRVLGWCPCGPAPRAECRSASLGQPPRCGSSAMGAVEAPPRCRTQVGENCFPSVGHSWLKHIESAPRGDDRYVPAASDPARDGVVWAASRRLGSVRGGLPNASDLCLAVAGGVFIATPPNDPA